MELQGKRIVLGVTGGIAAYKAAELVRLLGKQGADVQVAMTEGATHFVTTTTFQALSGKPVFTDQWDARMANAMAHIDLSRQADLILVAPASADFMARTAQGLADDLLATMVLARNCPLLIAPAMNRQMWENPATQRNVAQLVADGVQILGPASGEQACGEVGAGRMLEPAEILDAVIAFFTPKLLAVSGPVVFSAPQGVDRINVRSALDMHAVVMAQVARADIFIGVAAVADYRVANRAEHKLKKDAGGIPPIELIENPDILAEVAALENAPFCVGFAAESQHLEAYAQAKRRRKKIPLIAGNLIQDGFGGDDNRLVLFDDAGVHPLNPAPKSVLARQLIEHIANLTGKN